MRWGVAFEADRRGEAEFRAQRGTIMVVGDVGVSDAQVTNGLKLPAHVGEGLNHGKTTDFHGQAH